MVDINDEKYSTVRLTDEGEGKTIGEGWLKDAESNKERRQYLLQAMEISETKMQGRVSEELEEATKKVAMRADGELVNAEFKPGLTRSQKETQPRVLEKRSGGLIKKQLKREFEITDEGEFQYQHGTCCCCFCARGCCVCSKFKAYKFKKGEKMKATVESKSKVIKKLKKKDPKWTEKKSKAAWTQPEAKARVKLMIPQGKDKFREAFVYNSDNFENQLLMSEVMFKSDKNFNKLMKTAVKIFHNSTMQGFLGRVANVPQAKENCKEVFSSVSNIDKLVKENMVKVAQEIVDQCEEEPPQDKMELVPRMKSIFFYEKFDKYRNPNERTEIVQEYPESERTYEVQDFEYSVAYNVEKKNDEFNQLFDNKPLHDLQGFKTSMGIVQFNAQDYKFTNTHSGEEYTMDDYQGISSIYRMPCNAPDKAKLMIKGPYNITKSHKDKEACNDARKLKLAKTVPSRANASQSLMVSIESVTPSDPDDCEGAVRIEVGSFSIRTPFVPINQQQYVYNTKFKIDLNNIDEGEEIKFQLLKTMNRSEDQQEKEKTCKLGKFCVVKLEDFPQSMEQGQMEIRVMDGEYSHDIHDDEEDEEPPTMLRVKASNTFSSDLEDHYVTDLLDSNQLLVGQYLLYQPKVDWKYPSQGNFVELGLIGKHDKSRVGEDVVPLRIPTQEEFYTNFPEQEDYTHFLKEECKNKEAVVNDYIPAAFSMPSNEKDFEERQCPGDYEELTQTYSPHDTVTELKTFRIKYEATLLRVSRNKDCLINYKAYDPLINNTMDSTKKVQVADIEPIMCSGPQIFNHKESPVPNSIKDAAPDWYFSFLINEADVDMMIESINYHCINYNDEIVIKKKSLLDNSHISGQLYCKIETASDLEVLNPLTLLKTRVFMEVSTPPQYNSLYLDTEDETDDLSGEMDDHTVTKNTHRSKGKKYYQTARLDYVEAKENLELNQIAGLGNIRKNKNTEIEFALKAFTKRKTGDHVLYVGKMKQDEMIDPEQPAKQAYLYLKDLTDQHHKFVYSQARIKMKFLYKPKVGSSTQRRYWRLSNLDEKEDEMIVKHLSRQEFDEQFQNAYDRYIYKQKDHYVDRFGAKLPLGEFNPNLLDVLNNEEDFCDDVDEEVQDGGGQAAALKTAPDYYYGKISHYLESRSLNLGIVEKQMNNWEDFVHRAKKQINEPSDDDSEAISQASELDENAMIDGFEAFNIKHYLEDWTEEQKGDFWFLCKNGIPHKFRKQIWANLLNIYGKQEEFIQLVEDGHAKDFDDYNEDMSPYDNFKQKADSTYNLAFMQIDQDLKDIEKRQQEDAQHKRSKSLNKQGLAQIKDILRCFIVYQQHYSEVDEETAAKMKKQGKKIKKGKMPRKKLTMAYSVNFIKILQKLLMLYNEENAFWVFVSIMKNLEVLLNIEKSVLYSPVGMFRQMMTSIINCIQVQCPKIYHKFFISGLPLNFFIYDHLTSFMASSYVTETLFRLWDLIFLEISSAQGQSMQKCMGLLISGVLFLLRENEDQILRADTVSLLQTALQNCSSFTYDSFAVTDAIFEINEQNFVVSNVFNSTFASVFNVGDQATVVEKKRQKIEMQIRIAFDSVQAQNQSILDLFAKNEELAEGGKYATWKEEWLQNYVTAVSGKEVQEQEAGDGGDLKCRNVFLLLHQGFDVQEVEQHKTYRFSVAYNKRKIQHNSSVTQHAQTFPVGKNFQWEYVPGSNEVRVVVQEVEEGEELMYGFATLNLSLFKTNSVHQVWLDVRHHEQADRDIEIQACLFLEGANQQDSRGRGGLANCIKHKSPEFVDLFNKEEDVKFVKQNKKHFQKEFIHEHNLLKQFLPEEEDFEVTNEKYNFVSLKGAEGADTVNLDDIRIQLNDPNKFKQFVEEVFKHKYDKSYKAVFREFKGQPAGKKGKGKQTRDSTTEKELKDLDGMQDQSEQLFHIQQFVVSFVLLSQMTMKQKLEVLFYLFDWDDGERDGLDEFSINIMLKTIFNRCMLYIPSNQTENIVDLIFNGQPSCIIHASLIKVPDEQPHESTNEDEPMEEPEAEGEGDMDAEDGEAEGEGTPEEEEGGELEEVKEEGEAEGEDGEGEDDNIQVADEGQDNWVINITNDFKGVKQKHHRLYGCKAINFNPDLTPFTNLSSIVKLTGAEKKVMDNAEKIYLQVVYLKNGRRRVHRFLYNRHPYGGDYTIDDPEGDEVEVESQVSDEDDFDYEDGMGKPLMVEGEGEGEGEGDAESEQPSEDKPPPRKTVSNKQQLSPNQIQQLQAYMKSSMHYLDIGNRSPAISLGTFIEEFSKCALISDLLRSETILNYLRNPEECEEEAAGGDDSEEEVQDYEEPVSDDESVEEEDEFPSYAFISEIAQTSQWVKCRILRKKKGGQDNAPDDEYVVQLQPLPGQEEAGELPKIDFYFRDLIFGIADTHRPELLAAATVERTPLKKGRPIN